ncbi:hypothetical protein [Saccharomonospora cyanea]|uniref:Uncharacterized protein n=1 Tax=Saccharomonospora cyanea NA-134 TaxID=882082 RepID=H5XN21_9PSEU|nr:hypothetical protein [Saccharomonospora cyanea]EHR63188.1 hypothetical protein SaccyDRAFT_4376 [Saccharomonospora cyanea NA-134]
MQIEALNRRAQQKYATFVSAMDMVVEALEELDKFIDRIDDNKAEDGAWSVAATQDELKGYRRKAVDELGRLRAKAKKYEAELVSRDWRV